MSLAFMLLSLNLSISYDDQGWCIVPEQPLNISFNYFLEDPSLFPETTRISMFDPKDDGVEKALYLGKKVTVSGTFRFYRNDFETLYFAPYTITMGKNAQSSYAAEDLAAPEEPLNLYNPSDPLPKYMDPMVVNGKYVYNSFMLSRETLEFMGNDFAIFYVDFVDAVLNYQREVSCPDKRYAEMLSTVIYYEFPLFNACAEPFEFFKAYNSENETVTINYLYDEATHDALVARFLSAADAFLSAASPEQTDAENAKALYHAIASAMTYDYSALEEIERKESYYAYLENTGVCLTFANIYNQLLTQVGIDTTLAHCDGSDTIGHIWSLITLDGKQYFCDPTYELSYDKGQGYRFYGLGYADTMADGRGDTGIRVGRYYLQPLTPDMLAETSLSK